jgi:SAM-dependent methyltransferase
VKRAFRAAKLAALDLADRIAGRADPMVPPRRLVHGVGGMDFRDVGRHLAEIAIGRGGLRPHERILDAGCGVGRLAVPLAGYLTTGEYVGFDISRPAIGWCREAIESRHPNFRFVLADVFNSHYNPGGAVTAETYRFPCADASVDLVYASSLFTHLQPKAADRYLEESARVLKPGGRVALSFFLLDEAIRPRLSEFTPHFAHFPEPWYAVADPDEPEAAIAFDRGVVEEALQRHGFERVDITLGSWRFDPNALSFQEFVFAKKRS